MRSRRIGRSLFVLLVLTATACGKRESNALLAPTWNPDGGTLPIMVAGRVRESAPTETIGIPRATVRVADGENAGRSTTTDAMGYYTISGLRPGRFTIAVSAAGYVDSSDTVAAYEDNIAVNVYLPPVMRMVHHTSTGSISAGDGTCSDGAASRPCRILAIPVHNQGPMTATLTWVGGQQVDLDLTLFQTGQASPVAQSHTAGAGPEHIAETVRGGALYELRMTWAAGSGSADYTLDVTYPY